MIGPWGQIVSEALIGLLLGSVLAVVIFWLWVKYFEPKRR
jgi:hypothetical protein